MVPHLRGGSLVVISLYLWPGLGAKGYNQHILASLGSFVKVLADPCLIVGD